MRILVVEDDAVLRDGIVRLLNAQGYAVECAGGGGEALDLGALARPDLIGLDLGADDFLAKPFAAEELVRAAGR